MVWWGFDAAYCTADMRTCASFDKLAPWLVKVSEPLHCTTLRLSERLVTAPLMILRRSTLHDYMSDPTLMLNACNYGCTEMRSERWMCPVGAKPLWCSWHRCPKPTLEPSSWNILCLSLLRLCVRAWIIWQCGLKQHWGFTPMLL